MKENTTQEKIVQYKKDLIHSYTILMAFIVLIYALIFTFLIPDKIMSWYLFGGLFFSVYSFFIIRKNYRIESLVHAYIIIAPIYNFYVMLAFWDNSVASFVWLLPIPLGAYIFFTRKYVVIYSIYVVLNIILGFLVTKIFHFNFQKHSAEDIKMTDTFLLLSNLAVFLLLVYFKDKIRKVEIYNQVEEKVKGEDKTALGQEKEPAFYEELFEKIEAEMKDKKFYKDINFNISKLSVALNINSRYISQAIRYKGHPNFNNYLNIYRINCVKELLDENDIEKVTLLYIYTEAGFSNQSTFNRVFKQIEKITPSEYITSKQEIDNRF
ncbi:helix-turn-helix domain-containing protein [Chryseobacterium soli]|nr:helix-turn-helix domain-containing protein [Chryseobacterium soli]MDV7695630.1 helix-turn-helix domain-containing protein [Chryseobacterium soli]